MVPPGTVLLEEHVGDPKDRPGSRQAWFAGSQLQSLRRAAVNGRFKESASKAGT
jgi:hypothetical protein